MEAKQTLSESLAARKPSWSALLVEAVNRPGSIHEAYTRFHGYSLGNQLLALQQCAMRNIPSGPIATYPRWKELGRHVCKGQKAMLLCMPITCKGKETTKDANGTETEMEVRFTRFVYRPNWFVLAQTEGADYQAPETPDWKESDALQALKVEKIPFRMTDGNVQGYATRGRKVAINPVTPMPERIMFHEMAHILLGHCEEGFLQDSDITPRDIREMEAEGVALLCCESLGLEGSEYSRGYIQHWARGQNYTERSAQKMFHVADMILRAGNGTAKTSEAQ